jgi:ribosomal protein S18 acetylase RimI-like enzyme
VNDRVAGAINLAEYVRATAGRKGTCADLPDGLVVASPFPVSNGYVNAAISTRERTPAGFVDSAKAFFAERDSPFVLWALESDVTLIAEATRAGVEKDEKRAPAMVARQRVAFETHLTFGEVTNDHEADVFGEIAERGYGIPGFAWLLAQQDSYRGAGSSWITAFDEDQAVGVGCGFRHGRTGGIYSIATPPEHRGRGIAAALTGYLANTLFDSGAESVSLQASALGFGVYERLGFEVYDHYQRFNFAKQQFAERNPT